MKSTYEYSVDTHAVHAKMNGKRFTAFWALKYGTGYIVPEIMSSLLVRPIACIKENIHLQ